MALEVGSILDSWRGWDEPPAAKPVIVGELGGGRSNRSYLLDAGGAKMVLRINAVEQTLAGVQRSREADIWRAASTAGVAPNLLHADPAGRFLVSAYIESNLPTRPQDDPALAKMALELLQRCHRLDVDAPRIDYAEHSGHYWQTIEANGMDVEPGLREQRGPMLEALEDISGTPRALCHHDPVIPNFVGSPDRLYLIDWEYAARGLAIMDYAALAVEWKVDAGTLAGKTGLEVTSLTKAIALYRYLCALWSAVMCVE